MHEALPFGSWLREYRRAHDLTRGDLAQMIGYSTETIRKIESGERRPSKEVAGVLADKLDFSPDERRAFVDYARSSPTPSHTTLPRQQEAHPASRVEASTVPNNLTAPLTSLIGREREVATLSHYLRETPVRLLTLTGPPGVGKTRLAIQVGHDLLPGFIDGLFFVPLAAVADPSLVIDAIARVVGLEDAGHPLLPILSGRLRDKRMLLIIDNFEQVVEAGPGLLELLEGCPNLKTLVTSREPLHLPGEQQFVVPPLEPPQLSSPLTAASVNNSPAAALFVERARAVDPDFTLDDSNAPSVAALCAQLEGLPLAIELVAARVKILSPGLLLERMIELTGASRQLDLLTGGAHNSPARHRTLREAIGWSYNLLNEHERALLARLSVFSGGAALAAIEAVCNSRGDLGMTAFDLVESLLDKSLLWRDQVNAQFGAPELGEAQEPAEWSGLIPHSEFNIPHSGDIRFTILETIREYAAEQLAARAEADTIGHLHAQYYLALAQAADPQLTGAEQKAWLDRLERDHDNLRAALEWSLAHENVEMAAQLGVALKRFWEVHNHFGEGRRWLRRVLAESDRVSPQLRAKVLNAAGALAIGQSDFDEAFLLLEGSLALQRKLGDELGVASALNNLGMAALSVGKYEMAVPLFEEGLEILREMGDKGRTATMLGNFAVVISQLGDMDRAARLLNESLALRRELGNRWGVAAALGNLAEVLRRQGEDERAREVYAEAVELLSELGDKVGVAKTLVGFAAIAMSEGRPERAATLLSVTERILDSTGGALAVVDKLEYTRLVDETRCALDEAALEAAWHSGRELSLDEAISYALHDV